MRKVQLLGLVLLALFAFGVFTASAMATTLLDEWLVGGAAVTTELLVEVEDELLLEDSKVPIIGKVDILCSVIYDGWIGPNSLDYLSEVLNLSGVALSGTPLSGESIDCTDQTGCETNTPALIWFLGVPAWTESELLEQTGGPFFEDVTTPVNGEFGYEITDCLILGIAMEDECSTPKVVAELKLEGTTLLYQFSKAFTELAGSKLVLCTQSKEETGIIEGEGVYELSGGGELANSSETSEA